MLRELLARGVAQEAAALVDTVEAILVEVISCKPVVTKYLGQVGANHLQEPRRQWLAVHDCTEAVARSRK